jgi:hypothetical protein
MSKYDALANYLLKFNKNEIELDFLEIEKIIHSKLPTSAYTRIEWWANDNISHSQSKYGWLAARYYVIHIDLKKRKIKFKGNN